MQFTRPLSFAFPLLRGEDVRAVQLALTALGVQPPCGTADGVFGPTTREAVTAFQRVHSELQAVGVVDQSTWKQLFGSASEADVSSSQVQAAAAALVPVTKPPLTEPQVAQAKEWLMHNFGQDITRAAASSPFDVDLICAIACQETASKWLKWIDRHPPAEVLAHCVFDASGDYPGTSRLAFPRDTAHFRAKYGDALTDDLIAEANASRAFDGFPPEQWVYKGYGIFQYDLQHIEDNETSLAFFRDKQWREMSVCLKLLVDELRTKMAAAKNDLQDAVRRYNGGGVPAHEYALHVMTMRNWARQHAFA